jgi:ectoine hydroxylase-related dioxygenase (phytanoyl-CoA dioxygenase family)
MILTDDQLRQYDEDGFLGIERLVGADTVAALRVAYDKILDRRISAAGDRMLGSRIRQVMHPAAAHPVFDQNPALVQIAEIAQQVLGESVRSFDMLIYKPPGHAEVTPWHQEMAYAALPCAPGGVDIPLWTIQFWVALDDVDEENGCMKFLPGYHREPLREHYVAGGDPEDDGRLLAFVDPPSQVDLSRARAVPLPAGGATMHSYGTPHFTGPNRSLHRPRRAYIVNFANKAKLVEHIKAAKAATSGGSR